MKFQSSPAPKDGRYPHTHHQDHETRVSILARPEGRALHCLAHYLLPMPDVSILARPEGRALPTTLAFINVGNVFQSSPAPKDGRYREGLGLEARERMFQSSPAPKDGRYLHPQWERAVDSQFQSSPAPKDGRYVHVKPVDYGTLGFNPRPPRRTGATSNTGHSPMRCRQFQSSPAPKDGRYGNLGRQHRDGIVSILARPEGRALPKTGTVLATHSKFQSSPAPKDGRYVQFLNRDNAYQQVSILARPEGRALHVPAELSVFLFSFQSSPAPKDGRYRRA